MIKLTGCIIASGVAIAVSEPRVRAPATWRWRHGDDTVTVVELAVRIVATRIALAVAEPVATAPNSTVPHAVTPVKIAFLIVAARVALTVATPTGWAAAVVSVTRLCERKERTDENEDGDPHLIDCDGLK